MYKSNNPPPSYGPDIAIQNRDNDIEVYARHKILDTKIQLSTLGLTALYIVQVISKETPFD